ncbi:MAG: hypothetical protein RMX96_34230 [Nostoc sp. ChiSLP02]|nr:hypothetical protein [Nostoc sp. DedSLP01]MDZ8189881.1 hypothetical protein [Nostoc sp. ChiSLP02]
MAQALKDWALGMGHRVLDMGKRLKGKGKRNKFNLSPFPLSLCPYLMPHAPFSNWSILKTVLANYALDKLKIEIAGNSHPGFCSSILWERLRPNLGRIFSQASSLCEDEITALSVTLYLDNL